MAKTPITLDNGQVVTDWDDGAVYVTSPGGGASMKIARSGAPSNVNAAIANAETSNSDSLDGGVDSSGTVDSAPAVAPVVAAPPVPVAPVASQPDPYADPNAVVPVVHPAAFTPAGMTPPAQQAPAVAPLQSLPQQAPPAPAPQAPGDPIDEAQARLRALRAEPQVAVGGGGGSSSVSTTSIPDAARKDINAAQVKIDEAAAAQQKAIEAQALEEQKAQQKIADAHAADAAAVDAQIKQQEADQRAYEQRVQAETTKLDKLNQDANTQIDPGRWWKRADTGTKILAGISAFLGGFAQGYSGGKVGNPALDAINRAIDNDVEAQLQNRAGAQHAAGAQRSLIDSVREQYATTAQQKQALTILAHDKVAQQIATVSSQLQSQTAQARGAQAAAVVAQENQVRKQNLIAQTAGSRTVSSSHTAGGVVETPSGRAADALEHALYTDYDPKAYIPAALRLTGKPMGALSGDAKEINDKLAMTEAVKRDLDILKSLSGKKVDRTASALARSVGARLIQNVNKANKNGALDNQAERIVTESVIGRDPTSWYRPEGNAVLNNAYAALDASVRDTLKNSAAEVNPDRVPAVLMRQRSFGNAPAAPKTQPLSE